MTRQELIDALGESEDVQHLIDHSGEPFTIETSWTWCTTCGGTTTHDDSDEWILRAYDCKCRDADENLALYWARRKAQTNQNTETEEK